MSNESLFTLYRPQHFEDVVEQDAIKQILMEELKTNNIKRCLLFTGPAGCGKTTSARIYAKDVEPTKANIIEINCADHTGVEDVRQLVLEASRFRPLQGTYKIFILDECFTGDTLIATPNGNIPIKDIKIGDNVYNAEGVSKVIGVAKKQILQNRILQIKINGKWITTTREHLFFTEEGWVKAQDLKIGNFLYSQKALIKLDLNKDNIEEDIIIKVRPTELIEDINFYYTNNFVETMYDLQIEGHPSYFVNDVLVHNCHMLTPQSQNALLKILEEPPQYCIYILCTTDPQKVLPTILSRTFRYDFQLISYQGILDRLNYILTQEIQKENHCGIQSWDMDSLSYISLTSRGHMRDAINLMQKCISYDKNITIHTVEKVLGVTSYDLSFNVLNAIIQKNEGMLLEQLDSLLKTGMDLKLFVKNFLQFVLDVNKYLILKTENVQNIMNYLNLPPSYESKLSTYNISNRDSIKNLLKILLDLNSSLRWETNVRPVVETNLLLGIYDRTTSAT